MTFDVVIIAAYFVAVKSTNEPRSYTKLHEERVRLSDSFVNFVERFFLQYLH